jgi:hypothetical protein
MELPRGISRVLELSGESRAADLDRVGAALAAAKNQVREALQDLTGPRMEAVIKKLEDQEPLSPEEKEYVRAWVVGDAQSYTRGEKRLQVWLQEFKALKTGVENCEGKELSVELLLNLHALLEDAVRVAAHIEDFLEKKERIERFERTIQSPAPEDARFILGILKEQLRSEEV